MIKDWPKFITEKRYESGIRPPLGVLVTLGHSLK